MRAARLLRLQMRVPGVRGSSGCVVRLGAGPTRAGASVDRAWGSAVCVLRLAVWLASSWAGLARSRPVLQVLLLVPAHLGLQLCHSPLRRMPGGESNDEADRDGEDSIAPLPGSISPSGT